MKEKLITTSITVTREMQMRIVEYCEKYKVSRAEAIRQLIQLGLDSL